MEFTSNVEHLSWVSNVILYSETLFTLEKGKIKISNVSVLYCRPFVLSVKKRFFCIEIFNWNLKVSVVRRCPLRTVRYIEISLEVSSGRRCPLQRMSAIERFHCMTFQAFLPINAAFFE